MNLLAIDTSTERASVALLVKGRLSSKEQDAQRNHARLLLPMIEELLVDAGISLGQLDAIVYGQGPGSFTGLRIACSIAKGLAYAQDLPLYPVSSLAAIADEAFFQQGLSQNTRILAVLDARMNQLYWACYGACYSVEKEQVSAASEILIEPFETSLVLAGVGYEPYLQNFSSKLQVRIASHFIIYPKAEAMLRLALTAAIKPVSAAEALPVYIRNQVT